jgi:hypothetical protein
MNNSRRDVTPIGDLMDMDDLDTPPPQFRAIRNTSKTMYSGGGPGQMAAERSQIEAYRRQGMSPEGYGHPHLPPGAAGYGPEGFGPEEYGPMHREHYNPRQPQLREYLNKEPTCLEMAQHVKNCPICTKFYDNDKTVYIIIIIVLAIICILLLKRVLEL